MSNDESLTSEEIKSLRNLLDIEKIKELRLRYSYLMDARDLDNLMNVFADGAVSSQRVCGLHHHAPGRLVAEAHWQSGPALSGYRHSGDGIHGYLCIDARIIPPRR